MKRMHPLHEFMPYGAPDLIAAQRSHLSRALTLSSSSVAAAFLLGVGALALMPPAAPPREVVMPKFDMESIREMVAPEALPQLAPPAAKVRPADPTRGLPKIVPDETKLDPALVEEYRGYADQLRRDAVGGVTRSGEGERAAPPAPPAIEPDLPVAVVDEWPVAVVEVKPEYPDIARQAMVDGKVVVLVLVGRDGRVREAKLSDKFHVPMLDAVALEAAKKWVFSPALVNGKPVSVWTAIPFDFILQ